MIIERSMHFSNATDMFTSVETVKTLSAWEPFLECV